MQAVGGVRSTKPSAEGATEHRQGTKPEGLLSPSLLGRDGVGSPNILYRGAGSEHI